MKQKDSISMSGSSDVADIFAVPFEGQWLIWSPLAGSVFRTNGSGARALDELKLPSGSGVELSLQAMRMLDHLQRNKMIRPRPTQTRGKAFKPTSAYILPTMRCNLRCLYCFSNGGDSTTSLLPEQVGSILTAIVDNGASLSRVATITFHGGGEPTTVLPLLMQMTETFRRLGHEAGVKTVVKMVSNGIYRPAITDWIIRNLDGLCLSIDGVPEIQDRQRPTGTGGGSSEIVRDTCERFRDAGFRFSVRSTVTAASVERMADFIAWLEPFRPLGVQFEPLTICGRCYESCVSPPDTAAFISAFKEAFSLGSRVGVPVSYSGARPEKISKAFCGAAGRNLIIAPNGIITACHRVTTSIGKASEFIIGRVSSDGRVRVSAEKLCRLSNLTALPETCEGCFCRWNCAGGCYEQNRIETGSLRPNPASPRCLINKELLKFQLAYMTAAVVRFGHERANGGH